MHKRFFSILALALMVSLGTPAISAAYTVVNSRAVAVNDTYTFYLITYAFGHESRQFALPRTATRDSSPLATDLEYSLRTPEGLTVKDGLAAGMIWSSAATSGDQFLTPAGTSTRFTLAVLHAKSGTSSRANTLTVDALPFSLGNRTGTSTTALAPHELAPYTVSATGTTAIDRTED